MWTVNLVGKVRKNCKRLPKGIQEIFQVLLAELSLPALQENNGPVLGRSKAQGIVIIVTYKRAVAQIPFRWL